MTTVTVSNHCPVTQNLTREQTEQGKERALEFSVHVLLQTVWKKAWLCLKSRDTELKFHKHRKQKCRILALWSRDIYGK